jgi:hypothetical protein
MVTAGTILSINIRRLLPTTASMGKTSINAASMSVTLALYSIFIQSVIVFFNSLQLSDIINKTHNRLQLILQQAKRMLSTLKHLLQKIIPL